MPPYNSARVGKTDAKFSSSQDLEGLKIFSWPFFTGVLLRGVTKCWYKNWGLPKNMSLRLLEVTPNQI
jgi:hypothetical protein